ncbi:MAG: pyridoxine 5'-phosphate synthase [Phycisphaerales bacterium]|nr:pyridoxine 5'-phosphate synthase [Phycisphaerales bacterium]
MPRTMIELGVNIDHVATLREARRTFEPDPLWAAIEAQLGGADGITLHLREDRRHMQDLDLARLRAAVQVPLNLEMAATDEMVHMALSTRPDMAMLVPEGRHEVTTEGGLDVASDTDRLKELVAELAAGGMEVSAFIDADRRQIDAAKACGFTVCEIHTGPWAEAVAAHGFALDCDAAKAELSKIAASVEHVRDAGMRCNAGHGLTYRNVQPIAAIPGVSELHIGHSIISRSVFTGIRSAVAEMKRLMQEVAA